jgi:hypothetical protein
VLFLKKILISPPDSLAFAGCKSAIEVEGINGSVEVVAVAVASPHPPPPPALAFSSNPTCLPGSLPRRHSHNHTRRLLFFSSASSTLTHGDTPSAQGDGVVDVNPPRGTRDFPPEDMRLRTWLFDQFREVSRLMAFEEVDFPVLESEALFIRKAGEEITQQV